MDAEVIETILSGSVGSMEMTPGFLLIGAILMETAIVMVFWARVLAWRANRIANIITGVIHTGCLCIYVCRGFSGSLLHLLRNCRDRIYALYNLVCDHLEETYRGYVERFDPSGFAQRSDLGYARLTPVMSNPRAVTCSRAGS